MSDAFYGPFDHECFCDSFNPPRKKDYRSVFQQDLGRLMFTGAFRRLQAKTQVFQAGEYDFYRTRLTHSLDVAHIAKSISVFLRVAQPDVAVDPELLEAICLAHDIGHPPFGHAGERMLNKLMKDYGGFEGNAQTLRILTRTIYSRAEGRSGMSPSRALLDGILKYKRLYRDRGDDHHHFIYDDQREILEFCFETSDLKGRLGSDEINRFQSLECQIMDLADDVAYSSFDIVDGAKAGFLTTDKIQAWREKQKLQPLDSKHLDELVDAISKNNLQPWMNRLIGDLIQSARLVPDNNFLTSLTRRYGFRLVREPDSESRIRLHKALCGELVFGSSALQQIEFKGGQILQRLSEILFDNYLQPAKKTPVLVPAGVHSAVLTADGTASRARLLCDHLSGMTDAYALRSYKRLLDPDYGSISELI
jgi:dGTPase